MQNRGQACAAGLRCAPGFRGAEGGRTLPMTQSGGRSARATRAGFSPVSSVTVRRLICSGRIRQGACERWGEAVKTAGRRH